MLACCLPFASTNGTSQTPFLAYRVLSKSLSAYYSYASILLVNIGHVLSFYFSNGLCDDNNLATGSRSQLLR